MTPVLLCALIEDIKQALDEPAHVAHTVEGIVLSTRSQLPGGASG
jgi:hypothetical protein